MCKIRNKYRIGQIFPSLSLSFHAVSFAMDNRATVPFAGLCVKGLSTLSQGLQYFESRTAVFSVKYSSVLTQILECFDSNTRVFRLKGLQSLYQETSKGLEVRLNTHKKKRLNSLSKFGVSTSFPIAARISSTVQKRPPSSSSFDGQTGPS